MFKSTFIISLLFISFAFAANPKQDKPIYKLNIDLTLNGKHVASQGLLAHESEKSEIQQKHSSGAGSFIEVTPEEIDGELNKIHLKFLVGILVKGARQILSTPEMIVTEGKKSSITVGEDDGPDSFTLTVLANRQALKK